MKHISIDLKEKYYGEQNDYIVFVESINRLCINRVRHIDFRDGKLLIYYLKTRVAVLDLNDIETFSVAI